VLGNNHGLTRKVRRNLNVARELKARRTRHPGLPSQSQQARRQHDAGTVDSSP
jgi:hypothetical protein